MRERVLVRLFDPSDSLEELTDLLHAAYRQLGDMGLNYTAVDQAPETTRRRIEGRECWIALLDGRLVGSVVLHADQRYRPACARSPDTAYISQFGVSPKLQRHGLGRLLLDHVERRAATLGFLTVALDTAEPATHLVAWYARRGYRAVGSERFEGKTYRSVVMAKALSTAEP